MAEAKKKPTHTAYAVRNFQKDGGEEDASWSKIGVAWLHHDGKGFDVVLDALPINQWLRCVAVERTETADRMTPPAFLAAKPRRVLDCTRPLVG
jgi:hypothetical protein